MVKKSSIQTNHTRTYINLYDKDLKLEYDLTKSNLDLQIGISPPTNISKNSISSYFNLYGLWHDATIETDENSSNNVI